MKVTATEKGFFLHLREPGAQFEIPDEPSRKVTGNDDAVTEAIAVKGKVPQLFASSWMRPGWVDFSPFTPGVTDLGKMHASKHEAADLNASKI